MAQVKPRENTFRIDLTNFPKRPSFEDLHLFVHNALCLKLEQVVRLQMNHVQNCVHVKCSTLKIAQDTVDQHNGKHEIIINKTKVRVKLVMEDGGVEVKIHDLSENIRNDDIVAYLKQYGEIINLQEQMWGDIYTFKSRPSGVRVAKMILRRHIKSFVTIQGEQTLITYRGQPQTCKHCMNAIHTGISCVENKKLIGQKTDLNARLNSNRQKPEGYAGVLSAPPPEQDPLAMNFVDLNEHNRKAADEGSTSIVTAANEENIMEITDHASEKATSSEEAPVEVVSASQQGSNDQPNVPELSNALKGESWAEQVSAESTTEKQKQPKDRRSRSRNSSKAREVSTMITPTPVRTDVSPTGSFKKPLDVVCGGTGDANCSMEISDSDANSYDSSSDQQFITVTKGRDRSKKQRVGK